MLRSVLSSAGVPALVVSLGLFAGCAKKEPVVAPAAELPAAAAPVVADAPKVTALVALDATKGNKVFGTLTLEAKADIIEVTGQVSGLAPDADHGFHVHEKGDCKAPDASSAGAHFNPTQQQHGRPDAPAHHAGDMLNIHADAMGNALVDLKLTGVTLKDGGPNDISKKAIVIHEKPDDYTTQPSGDSGSRIACGVIG